MAEWLFRSGASKKHFFLTGMLCFSLFSCIWLFLSNLMFNADLMTSSDLSEEAYIADDQVFDLASSLDHKQPCHFSMLPGSGCDLATSSGFYWQVKLNYTGVPGYTTNTGAHCSESAGTVLKSLCLAYRHSIGKHHWSSLSNRTLQWEEAMKAACQWISQSGSFWLGLSLLWLRLWAGS